MGKDSHFFLNIKYSLKKILFVVVFSGKWVTLPYHDALVAQRIEQLPSKQWVAGSIPARGAIFFAFFEFKSPVFQISDTL